MTLSEDCKDFLRNLLLHDPEKRISYEMFFNHQFLDLEHVPSEISHKKALKILKDADNLDAANKHIEAFNRYCEGLRYLFPILSGKVIYRKWCFGSVWIHRVPLIMFQFFVEETSEEKKIMLRAKVTRYTKRAEELKCMLSLNSEGKSETPSKATTPISFTKKIQTAGTERNDSAPCRAHANTSSDKIVPKDSKLKQLSKNILLIRGFECKKWSSRFCCEGLSHSTFSIISYLQWYIILTNIQHDHDQHSKTWNSFLAFSLSVLFSL